MMWTVLCQVPQETLWNGEFVQDFILYLRGAPSIYYLCMYTRWSGISETWNLISTLHCYAHTRHSVFVRILSLVKGIKFSNSHNMSGVVNSNIKFIKMLFNCIALRTVKDFENQWNYLIPVYLWGHWANRTSSIHFN